MIKTFTFAILHFGVAFGVTYALTGSVGISSSVALIEPLVNTVVFYFHEKAWKKIEDGQTNAVRHDCMPVPLFDLWHRWKHR